MSDSDLIEKFQAETHYQLGNDVIQDLINMVREHDALFNAYVAGENNDFEPGIRSDERAKTLAEVRPIVERLYVLCSKHVDIRHHDWNEVLKLGKAIDGVEK